MSKTKIDRERLLKKFKTLSATSICIQKTSKYLYQFYKSSDIIVNVWLQALNTANTDTAKISLFYIANEMLQSKNYGSNYFKQSWKPHLLHSIDCIKNSSVDDKIRRILKIWIERKVYDHAFIENLIGRLSAPKNPTRSDEQCKNIIMNFEPEEVIEKLKELINVENESIDSVKNLEVSINFDEKSSKEAIKNLKDKVQSNQFSELLDNNINKLFQICTLLEEELKVRQRAIEAMNNAEIYYETQQTETLVVEDAYRRYGIQISKTKEALEEHLEFLMEDGGPIDLDDAPSPGKTPPHLYREGYKNTNSPKNSPMSYDDPVSPSQSMDMSEEDTPMDKSGYLDKPYSPSHELHTPKSHVSESTTSLSSTEALKLLTSVFSQSLTKKSEINTKVNLQSDIFRNTLATTDHDKTTNDEKKGADKPDTVFADAFRLISNLTGLKSIGDRTMDSESSKNAGTTIPTLTSNMGYQNADETEMSPQNEYTNRNQSNFISANSMNGVDNIPQMMYPDMQHTPFLQPLYNQQSIANNPMFPVFNNQSLQPSPMPALFNTLSNNVLPFNMATLNRNHRRTSQSPGSCTDDDDEGGATPTQDEPALLNSALPATMFNQNVLPALAAGAAEINKQIQNAMNSGNHQFGLQNMLSVSKDGAGNQWSAMCGQFPFSMAGNVPQNMSLPFQMMNQNQQIQPIFTPTSSVAPNFGPPRAIRTKRPNADSVSTQDSACNAADSGRTNPSPPTLQSEHGSTPSDTPVEEQESVRPTDSVKNADIDADVVNLYGDVEEELERNYSFYQQSVSARNSRPAPPVDRYHLYNNGLADTSFANFRFNEQQQQQNSSSFNRPRMNYPQNVNFARNQTAPRGHTPYFPNRSTNFKPKNNSNMFH